MRFAKQPCQPKRDKKNHVCLTHVFDVGWFFSACPVDATSGTAIIFRRFPVVLLQLPSTFFQPLPIQFLFLSFPLSLLFSIYIPLIFFFFLIWLVFLFWFRCDQGARCAVFRTTNGHAASQFRFQLSQATGRRKSGPHPPSTLSRLHCRPT